MPKIKGKVFQSFGATLASAEADAFHSYGLGSQKTPIPGTRSGPDASYTNISVRAAVAYCSALNYLLEDEECHIYLGPVAVCVWTREPGRTHASINKILNQAYPEQVRDLLRSPYAGDRDREVLHQDRLYTVALSGNKGRVAVRHWLDQPLIEAIANLQRWWDDLQIAALGVVATPSRQTSPAVNVRANGRPSPYAIRNLVHAIVPESRNKGTSKNKKKREIGAEKAVLLYRAAMEGIALPVTMLKPILDEFHSALVKDSEKTPTYPFTLSRFALIKLILVRLERQRQPSIAPTNNILKKEGGFMPEVELANTCDPAYNCGRLLAVLQALQLRSRRVGKPKNEKKKTSRPGAGVVERYYGRASTAPAMVFPLLLHLSRHHMAKLQQGDESDGKAAAAIERRKAEIIGAIAT